MSFIPVDFIFSLTFSDHRLWILVKLNALGSKWHSSSFGLFMVTLIIDLMKNFLKLLGTYYMAVKNIFGQQ